MMHLIAAQKFGKIYLDPKNKRIAFTQPDIRIQFENKSLCELFAQQEKKNMQSIWGLPLLTWNKACERRTKVPNLNLVDCKEADYYVRTQPQPFTTKGLLQYCL